MSRLLSLTALAVLCAASAQAHATLDVAEAAAGGYHRIAVRIGHGCDGAATHTLEVMLPAALAGAKPMPKPGWTLAVEPAPEGGRLLRWSGGDLADGHYDEFIFRGKLDAEPGAALAVPVRQLCAGGEAAWVQLAAPGQDPHDLAFPAPVLRVAGSAGEGHHHHGPAAGAAEAGPLSVQGAFARANPAPGGASAAYMTIATTGAADRLIAAESPAAARVELHTHTLDAAGVARMRQVEAIDVAPGHPTELKPGGLHVMLMGLVAPLQPGGEIALTLVFEKAGRVTLTAPVLAVTGGHNHGG